MSYSADGNVLGGQTSGDGEALLSERLRWLREVRGEVAGLLAAEEARLEHFQAVANAGEERLLKRVKLTHEAERRRAHEHHHALSEPLRHQLGTIQHQLSHLETLADTIIATSESPSVKEMQRLLTLELPLPSPAPSSSELQEAWERICPPPQWKLTCHVLSEQDALSTPADHSNHTSKARVPRWPSPERASFKGGTSLPLPRADSESSGSEDFVAVVRPEAARLARTCHVLPSKSSVRRHQDRAHSDETVDEIVHDTGCMTSEESSVLSSQFWSTDSHGYKQRRSQSTADTYKCSRPRASMPVARQMGANWMQKWLNSNQLNDLIEVTAELEAIKRVERRHSAVMSKRRLGPRT